MSYQILKSKEAASQNSKMLKLLVPLFFIAICARLSIILTYERMTVEIIL